jgi:flagellar hook-length control protein FliK
LARPARPTQQPDRAPSPFESLLDDGAQATDQPAPTPPDDKVTRADSSQPVQPPARTKDTKPAANDNAAAPKSDEGDAVDKPDDDGKAASGNKTAVDAKIAETATVDNESKPAGDDKPVSEQKSDVQTSAPPAGNVQTINAADAIAVVPTLTPRSAPDRAEHVVQLPEQAAPVAENATQSKPLDPELLKVVAGKPVDARKQADSAEPIDADQSADETTDDSQLSVKIAPQPPVDKPQIATTESDQHATQARGEIPAKGERVAPDAPMTISADANATAPNTGDTSVQPTIATPAMHATQAAAAPAALVSQSGPQAAAVPLAGVAIEIASKALAGKNRFEIRLDPPELGRIEVRLDVDRDGNVTSRLTVDRADTLDLLRRDASGLERALQDAGLKTADNGLQFSLRDQSMGQQQTSGSSDAVQLVVNDETPPSIDINLQNYGRLAGQGGGLDIRV